ncbi:UDP-N-acetylglucosamine 2-epimerase (hydrolyzing) [Paenibacillus sp. 598K]|uniref:UDP-N-acetylglucosamine 2-epimerase n=1 Tax=Paenibacillus sp. 598K TaxID=1117987 RepID=UPI000FF9F707|nr:UDP-N-acetylglucosamine 2-epimerase [Paenibacillus sp. 598K]GBF75156.1 UDP-N-acetylglucosamine 2-epimerase (hydrolyzing) [Paenibacillus sp. 598K]
MHKPAICVVTGSRADYGLLRGLLHLLQCEASIDLQLAVTGMHWATEYGSTWREIEADGFPIAARIETLLASDTAVGTSKSMALGIAGFADAFARLTPDWVVVLGDRYETLAAALAAYNARIRIAHIAGGDISGGALDDGYRHSISKLAQLHFVSHEQARRRLLQLGEAPETVQLVGHPGIDAVRDCRLLGRQELEACLGCVLQPVSLLVTYHPATLSEEGALAELSALLTALDGLDEAVGLYFTGANADAQGREADAAIRDFVQRRPHARSFVTLGTRLYLSLAQAVDAVVGNSSSGLLEVPSLRTPTVDIGARQRGRFRGDSVIHSEAEPTAIQSAIHRALRMERSSIVNPYGDGRSSKRIAAALLARLPAEPAGSKSFYEVQRP